MSEVPVLGIDSTNLAASREVELNARLGLPRRNSVVLHRLHTRPGHVLTNERRA